MPRRRDRRHVNPRVSALSKIAILETSLVIHWPLFLPAPPPRRTGLPSPAAGVPADFIPLQRAQFAKQRRIATSLLRSNFGNPMAPAASPPSSPPTLPSTFLLLPRSPPWHFDGRDLSFSRDSYKTRKQLERSGKTLSLITLRVLRD